MMERRNLFFDPAAAGIGTHTITYTLEILRAV
jgi:hypothetical protein